MDVESDTILGWARMGVLILCMGWAAWFDHKERRVSNEHWMVWTKPIVFIWSLDLLMQGPHWSVWLTASALLAYASGFVLGRPTMKDARQGNRMDQIVLVWYLFSSIGLVAGALRFMEISPLDVLIGEASAEATLWWSYIAAMFTLFVIDLAWRFRFIHGGADAKALMWVTLGRGASVLRYCHGRDCLAPPSIAESVNLGRIFVRTHSCHFVDEEHCNRFSKELFGSPYGLDVPFSTPDIRS